MNLSIFIKESPTPVSVNHQTHLNDEGLNAKDI